MRELILTGRLVSDAETKVTANGKAYLTMRVANNDSYDGSSMYFEVQSYDHHHINNLKQYLTKGSGVDIIGELRGKAYIKNNGEPELDLRVIASMIKFHNLGGKKNDSQGEVQIIDGVAISQDVELPKENQDDLPF